MFTPKETKKPPLGSDFASLILLRLTSFVSQLFLFLFLAWLLLMLIPLLYYFEQTCQLLKIFIAPGEPHYLCYFLKVLTQVAKAIFPISIGLLVRVENILRIKNLFQGSKMLHGSLVILLRKPRAPCHPVIVLSAH